MYKKDKNGGSHPQKDKLKYKELDKTIILLKCPEKEDLKPSKYVDHICHNNLGNST